jgi:hypothetical protein
MVAGDPDYVPFTWQGVHGPAGMSPEVVATLNQAVREAVNTPEGKRFFAAYGSETGSVTAADFADFVKQELKHWEGATCACFAARAQRNLKPLRPWPQRWAASLRCTCAGHGDADDAPIWSLSS